MSYIIPFTGINKFKYLLFIVGMWEILKEQHSKRKNDKDVITDIYDADAMSSDPFFDFPENAGIMLCTDGVPVFKSSGM